MATVRGVFIALFLVLSLIGPAALSDVLHAPVPSVNASQDAIDEPTATSTADPAAVGQPPAADPLSDPAAGAMPDATTTYSLLLSKASDRSSPVLLAGQTISGNIYVFVSPASGISQVRFFIDNTTASGTPFHTENIAPWDLMGGDNGANPYDSRQLSNGSHSITASLSLSTGQTTVTTSSFTVNNAPTATPTRTAAPTATPTRTPVPTATPTGTATPASVSYANYLSKASDRSSPVLLAGQTISGNIYVFVSPASGISQVRFFIDNTTASGTPFHTENIAPWDLMGGDNGANPYDSRQLSNGSHSITASLTLSSGAIKVTTAGFSVNNPTATPTATPKPGPIYWGVNMQGLPEDMVKLSNWERDVAGKGAPIVHWGLFWGKSDGTYNPWPSQSIVGVRSHGSIPMISWTPEGGTDNTRWQLIKIINGVHDPYIRQFATNAKTWGQPFFLRMMHEMNGNWGWAWQETQNGNQPGQFVQAWRHIVDIFRSVGVPNVSFVWCPNVDYAGSTWPTFASLYPGDGYVDWTCLDGYNWGATRTWGWQTFVKIFDYPYNQIVQLAPSKPMMIGEYGVVEEGGSKSSWLTDTMSVEIPTKYRQIRAPVYFNWQKDGVDWRIETSSTSISAWKSALASSYYSSNTFASLTGKIPVP